MQPESRTILISFVLFCFTGLSGICQERTRAAIDTSYFIPYDNDFNLIISADKGHIENVKLLLTRGANINAATYEGVTALMYAADKGDLGMVKFLVENGADTGIKPLDGPTALMSAARNNHFEVAELLAKNTENPNIKDSFGVTAVHYAAAFNNYEITDMLIFYGGNPEIQDLKGNTPLITASFNNCYEAADILIQNGAELNLSDLNGYTALMAAIQENNQEIINLLIEKGAKVNYVNNSGISPLILAIKNQDIELTKKLLDLGAKVNEQHDKSLDVFEIARGYKNKELSDLLIANDIRPLRRPNFTKISVGPAVDFNSTDFMNGLNIGILDTKYNIGGFTGFYFRPAANRVLYMHHADTSYQYWERRYYFHAGVQKRFAIAGGGGNAQSGPMIGLREIVTFGNYRGSKNKPGTKFITVPEIGWYYMSKSLLFQINYEYMNLKTPDIKSGRLNFSTFYNIQLKRKSLAQKKISWLSQ